ncbi:MAG: chlorophyll synthesis pathway protein BchC [Pseudomonadales bacterium]|jgi:3-hydroxyethyl bacteriochlorophyllide a dehydrogenase|nr:chlorophyll synthesis pathway protein BchC [Pseudomonadales bacterium]
MGAALDTRAVVLEQPEKLVLSTLALTAPTAADVVVEVYWSGISTGTERLLYTGAMPPFPGMGYPLVPGYESVGRVVEAGPESGRRVGDLVFVPGAACFGEVRGLFGGAASRLVVPGQRVLEVDESLGEQGVLLALAATAHHALAPQADATPVFPDLVVGHGVLGRLIARIAMALGAPPPTVWETQPRRMQGATGYPVVHPDDDARRDYRCICDVSGDAGLLDTLISRLGRGGEIVLAGFYSKPLSFEFPPAFMREVRLRVATEFQPSDLSATRRLLAEGLLSLDGLVTHRAPADDAADAYRIAFTDVDCLKMVLNWRQA